MNQMPKAPPKDPGTMEVDATHQNNQQNNKPSRAAYVKKMQGKCYTVGVGQTSMPRETVPINRTSVIIAERWAIRPQYVLPSTWGSPQQKLQELQQLIKELPHIIIIIIIIIIINGQGKTNCCHHEDHPGHR